MAMRKIFLILGIASCSIAAPQNNNLDSLITNIFGTPQNPQISDPSSTTSDTILGTENRPKQPETNCECVPYYLCHNGSILENGTGIIDIRALGQCENYLDVCCKPPDRIEKVTPPPVEKKGTCGQRHPQGVGFRITGDVNGEAQFGEFPWMVAIIKEENIGEEKLNVYQCGGSLIHKQAVLTAAHCVQGKQASELRIRAGEWDTQTKNEIFPHQDRNVQNVIIHENFAGGTLYNDFAILILSEPLNLMENVDLVCLPERNTVFDGTRCFASGWGKDKFGKEGHYQVILKKINLPVVPHNQCQDLLRKTRLGKYFVLDSSFICAGGESDKDTCKGDGGSPLVCPSNSNPNIYLQAGIVAWGIGCGEGGIPGVYANVASVRDWIDEQMAFYNLDNTVYQPNQPNVTRLSDVSVMVRWSVPENTGLPIQFFKVQYRELGQKMNGKQAKWMTANSEIPNNVRAFEVTDLQPDHTYRFRIAAVYSNNDNKLSPNSVRFHLNKDGGIESNKMPIPLLTNTEALGPHEVLLIWQNSDKSANIDGFYVYHRASTTAGDYIKTTVEGKDSFNITISHLQPDTTYEFKVQSFSVDAASEFSQILRQKTKKSLNVNEHNDYNNRNDHSSNLTLDSRVRPADDKNVNMYAIIGGVLGGSTLLGSLTAVAVIYKRTKYKQSRESSQSEGKPITNGRIMNGGVTDSKINITSNPLAGLDTSEDIIQPKTGQQSQMEMASFLNGQNNSNNNHNNDTVGTDQ